jgi:uncharacterized protein YkwD
MFLVVLSHYVLIAQDSLSIEFIKVYNQYRIKNNLPLIQYDMQLDSFAMIRLVESAQGTDDCFNDSMYKCKDGLRNLHYRFVSNATDFNNTNSRISVEGENMAVFWGYFSAIKIQRLSWLTPYITKDTIITPKISSIKEIAEEFLAAWISSPGHNQLLLSKRSTLFAFKIYRTLHNNKPYVHGVFVMGSQKPIKSSKI